MDWVPEENMDRRVQLWEFKRRAGWTHPHQAEAEKARLWPAQNAHTRVRSALERTPRQV